MTPDMLTWQLAVAAFDRKDFRVALVHLTDLLDRFPHDRQVRELRARAYFHTASLGRAEADARALVDADPTDAYALHLLARALERQNRADEARGVRRRLAVMSGDEDLAASHPAFR